MTLTSGSLIFYELTCHGFLILPLLIAIYENSGTHQFEFFKRNEFFCSFHKLNYIKTGS